MRPDVDRVPGFTAEAAMHRARGRYGGAPAAATADAAGAIAPSLIGRNRRAGMVAQDYAITMTCSGSDWQRCQATCDALGGGMSSNPSGTVSCTIY